MSRDNVVPFAAPSRDALARRGAPDKARVPVTVEIECPRCAAVLCVDAGALSVDPEILCSGCDTSFSLVRGEAVAD